MDEIEKIRSREEIPVEDTWATEDLFVSDEAWEKALEKLQEDQKYLASFKGKLADSADNLLAYLTRLEQVNVDADVLATYCCCKNDQDTRNSVYVAMRGRFMNVYVGLSAAISFETPEITDLSDEKLEKFYAARPELARYRRYLTDQRRRRAHILSAAEEKLLAAAGEMAGAPDTIFSALENADMTFPDAVDSEGMAHPLSSGTFVLLQSSSDRELRRSAYENLYHRLGEFRHTSAALLNAQNRQLEFFANARKYNNAFEEALDANNVPTDVYLNLIEAVHQNLDKMHRYVRLRKKLLGVDELHFYDVYTNLVQSVNKKIPFAEAKQTVYDALYPLGQDYRDVLKKGMDSRWIDVYENAGKTGGAYSSGGTIHPYVLLNYTGSLKSQFTLAHEMGHAMHSYLSNKHQNPMDANYVIFVAEVASTCNEALLMEYLLSKTTDRKERAFLINHFLEQFKGTIYRQTMFAEFELNIGRMAAAGKTLTADVLCTEYRRLNEMYFGPDMVVDDEIAMEWARIPHFYYDYYVFQYATGYAAAIALSRRILQEGESAVKDYLNFLSGGCSRSPIDLLKGAGVDMTTPAPVSEALQLFGRLLDEMEALMED